MTTRRWVRGGVAVAAAVWTATGAWVSAVHAVSSSHGVVDGQILYEVNDPSLQDLALYVVNPDGSGAHQAYSQPMECPHWSPDGSLIASCGAPDPDSTTILEVDTGATVFEPNVAPDLVTPCYVFSRDGTRLACEGFSFTDDQSRNGLFSVRIGDWGDVHRITLNNGGGDVPGDYSPNSSRLVFERGFADDSLNEALYVVNANGTGLRRLSPPSLAVGSPGSWSPQGNEILFSAHPDSDHRQALFVVNSDGTGLRQLAVDGVPCGGPFDDPDSIGCANPTWSPSGRQLAFKINSRTGSVLERAAADGSHPAFVTEMGFDSGEDIHWGTHPVSTGP